MISLSLWARIAKHQLFLAYALTGAVVTGLELLLLYILVNWLLWPYLLASSFAFAIGLVASFFARKILVFKNSDWRLVLRQFALYSLILAVNVGLNAGLMYAMVDWLSWPYLWSQIVSNLLLGLISYTFNRLFTFAPVSHVRLNLPGRIDLIKQELTDKR